jgi:hypothetical protein
MQLIGRDQVAGFPGPSYLSIGGDGMKVREAIGLIEEDVWVLAAMRGGHRQASIRSSRAASRSPESPLTILRPAR